MNTRRISAMILVVKHHHSHQFRGPDMPYWQHCLRVADILDEALTDTSVSISSDLREDLYLAALGHDLYEDTAASPAEIRGQFGERVDRFIRLMTNPGSDDDRAAYVAQIRTAPEEIKLIKLADMVDNTAGCAYRLLAPELGLKWATDFFLPIISEMRDVMAQARFQLYDRAAQQLRSQFEFGWRRLQQNLHFHQRPPSPPDQLAH